MQNKEIIFGNLWCPFSPFLMAEAAARPAAGEKLAFFEDLLNEEAGRDFPRAIPKEARSKAREKDIYVKERKNMFRRVNILLQK